MTEIHVLISDMRTLHLSTLSHEDTISQQFATHRKALTRT